MIFFFYFVLVFGVLQNYHIDADEVNEDQYNWVAKVIHSRNNEYPIMCSANCLSERVFLTTARCIYGLTPRYTRIAYKDAKLPVLAFILPQRETKQLYLDLGFIVTSNEWSGPFSTAKISDVASRDASLSWFETYNYTVVGYATLKRFYYNRHNGNFNLTQLPVILNMNLCRNILTLNGQIDAFFVPCYHSCTYQQFQDDDEDCDRYHGVAGGAIINQFDEIVGIATWGSNGIVPLPVGFAPLTGQDFWNHFDCAKLLAEIKEPIEHESLQSVCDKLQPVNISSTTAENQKDHVQ